MVRHVSALITPTRRGKSLSPKPSLIKKATDHLMKHKIPYIDQSSTSVLEVKAIKKEIGRKFNSKGGDFPPNIGANPLPSKPIFEEDLLKIEKLKIDMKTSDVSTFQ